jgi:hypothetical protein
MLYYKHKDNDGTNVNAIGILALIQSFTIVNIFYFFRIFINYDVPPAWTILPIIVVFMIINWMKFERVPIFQILHKKWSNESKRKKTVSDLVIIIYMIISFSVPMLEAIIYVNTN